MGQSLSRPLRGEAIFISGPLRQLNKLMWQRHQAKVGLLSAPGGGTFAHSWPNSETVAPRSAVADAILVPTPEGAEQRLHTRRDTLGLPLDGSSPGPGDKMERRLGVGVAWGRELVPFRGTSSTIPPWLWKREPTLSPKTSCKVI